MSRLKRLVAAIDPRAMVRNAHTIDSLKAATSSLREELRSIHGTLTDLTAQLTAMQLQIEQLVALHREEVEAPARMDALQRILNTDRIAAHVRQAIERTEIVEGPVPYGITAGLLPAELYDALLDAIPPPVFFEAAGREELRVPPRTAPTHSVATWVFFADFVDEVIGPALIERFRVPLDLQIGRMCPSLGTAPAPLVFSTRPGRIVRTRPGANAPLGRARPWDFLTTVVYLAKPDDLDGYGSQIHTQPVSRDSESPVDSPSRARPNVVPFRANSALTVVDTTGAHEDASIPSPEPASAVRYSYEFRMGPDDETRRLMLERMDEASRRMFDGPRAGHS